MLLDAVIIKCSLHMQEERTTAAIFHLLNGKRSIQTVHDAHIFQLEEFYGVHQQLTKQTWERKMDKLIQQSLLVPGGKESYKPGKQAEKWLKENVKGQIILRFRGLKYYKTGPAFLQRLLLLIQTLTNSKMDCFTFIPVIDKTSITSWVKYAYKHFMQHEHQALPKLYREMYALLNGFSDVEAALFVDRLTGYKNYGKSIEQLAIAYQKDVNDIQMLLTSMIHNMLDEIIRESARFPVMSFIINDLPGKSNMTLSAQKTYQLSKRGYAIKQIAQVRKLKVNTIYDHIIEIALYDESFPIENYVDKYIYETILKAIKQTQSYKLKQIKDSINEDISYFQIRLTLASAKNSLKSGD